MLDITQETHAPQYTGNTCSTKLTKQVLYITQETKETHARYYIKNKFYITQEIHAEHYTGNTCTTVHRNHMLY